MVASHTETPLCVSKWLGKRHHTPRTLLLGKGHTQHMSPTQGQAYILMGQHHTSHFAAPKGAAVWLATIV